jgi:hypothetical protein
MDRQTPRDRVHRFNEKGPDGLFDHWTSDPTPRLRPKQLAELARIVEAGPRSRGRWRRARAADGPQTYHRRAVRRRLSRTLCRNAFEKLGFSHITTRPRHPAQDKRIAEAFNKHTARPVRKGFFERAEDQSAATYPASEASSQPRWRYARPRPHKLPGVKRRFLYQAARTPFDCQAISLSPLANIIDRSGRHGVDRSIARPPRAIP